MEWLAASEGRRGRTAISSEAAVRACLMLKALLDTHITFLNRYPISASARSC
jgi:hypothetical protein